MHRPRRPVPAPAAPPAEDAAFQANVNRWCDLMQGDSERLRERLAEEVRCMHAEQRDLTVPEPRSSARSRLDAWFRERSRRVGALSAALAHLLGPPQRSVAPPNRVHLSPCELSRKARLD